MDLNTKSSKLLILSQASLLLLGILLIAKLAGLAVPKLLAAALVLLAVCLRTAGTYPQSQNKLSVLPQLLLGILLAYLIATAN